MDLYEATGKEKPKSKSFQTNIETDTTENTNYRKVLHTTDRTQLVLMCLKPGEDIGAEVHKGDQFIRIESGEGKSVLNDKEEKLSDGSAIVVSEGTNHNIINTSETMNMTLYAVYSPPQHKDGHIDKDKPNED